jgi:(hydroxyamino)benzene mutase
MGAIENRLCFAGLAMFVFGLALGFFLKAFANPRAALSAHLNAVQSGTFLMVLALLWPHLSVWPGLAAPIGWVVAISFWTLEGGMVLGACAPAAEGPSEAPAGPLRHGATAVQGVGALAMLPAVGALLWTFPNLLR